MMSKEDKDAYVEMVLQSDVYLKPVAEQNIFMMAVQTNNDIEGWHHASNRRVTGRWQTPFYLLIELLHERSQACCPSHQVGALKESSERSTDPYKVNFLTTGRITKRTAHQLNSF